MTDDNDYNTPSLTDDDGVEFTAPEGHQFDPEVIKAYARAARAIGLPVNRAQKLLDVMVPVLHEQRDRIHAREAAEWAEAVQADEEIGGDNFAATVKAARHALERFGTPGLRDLVLQRGLANHPEFVRLLARAGAGGGVQSQSDADPQGAEALDRRYPSSAGQRVRTAGAVQDVDQRMLDARYPSNGAVRVSAAPTAMQNDEQGALDRRYPSNAGQRVGTAGAVQNVDQRMLDARYPSNASARAAEAVAESDDQGVPPEFVRMLVRG